MVYLINKYQNMYNNHCTSFEGFVDPLSQPTQNKEQR